ncbi:MAG: hypothetical protein GY820_09450 [Gammaproteobacteria bacterium]|nr:hypothetical protein [Gammaproteobacteria bacterium]
MPSYQPASNQHISVPAYQIFTNHTVTIPNNVRPARDAAPYETLTIFTDHSTEENYEARRNYFD